MTMSLDPVTIKKYGNRRLYNTSTSAYRKHLDVRAFRPVLRSPGRGGHDRRRGERPTLRAFQPSP
jgi:hypothetical protein